MASSEEYKTLKDDIQQLCNRSNRKVPDNILLVGKTGAGKSAIVNTLIRAVSGQYLNRAKVGAGDTASKTLQLVLHKNCGVVADDLGKNSAVGVKEPPMLSNVYDMPGLGDFLRDDIKEIIRLFIAGRIPDQTDITEIRTLQNEDGVGNLGLTFNTVMDSAKIDKVVFVQSAVDTIPTQLISSLREVLKETDPKTCRRIHNSDLFLLITHYDLVHDDPLGNDQAPDPNPSEEKSSEDAEDHSTSDTTREFISRAEFEAKERQLARLFNIKGNLAQNRMHWTSLCDATGYDDADICAKALKFLKLMMTPTVTAGSAPPKTVVTLMSRARVKWRRAKPELARLTTRSLFCVVLVIAVAIVAYFVKTLLETPANNTIKSNQTDQPNTIVNSNWGNKEP